MRARSDGMPSAFGIAEPARRQRRTRRGERGRGAGAAGWPTSMWMTWPPAASMRAAAAITSITMNGGTSLRAEGTISRFAASSMISSARIRRAHLPRCCRIRRFRWPRRGRLRGINLPGAVQWGRFHVMMHAAARRDIDVLGGDYTPGNGEAHCCGPGTSGFDDACKGACGSTDQVVATHRWLS